MKNFLKFFLFTVLGYLVISCTEDDDKTVLNNTGAGTLTANKSAVVLDEMIAEQTAITFAFTNPAFAPNVAVSNTMEFALAGTNFSPMQMETLTTDQNTFSLTHVQLNNILASLNIAPNVSKQLQVRLKSAVNSTSAYYSNVLTINVTGYTPNPDLVYPKINVPGGYAGAAGYADWNPANAANLYSPEKDNKYRGFIYVTAPNSEYKFTINQDWAGDKGDDGTFTGKLVENNEQNIKAQTPGTYYLKVDWLGNTYSATKLNFGMLGDATPTGYSSDTDFVYNPVTKTYVINSIALTNTGLFKFRANDDWAVKIQPAGNDQTLTSGVAVKTFISNEGTVSGDPNYKVAESGNYKVELDLHNSAYYKLTLTKL